jgi:hypothetical protein
LGGWNRGGSTGTTTGNRSAGTASSGVINNTNTRSWNGGQTRTASYSNFGSANTGVSPSSGRSYGGVSRAPSIGGSHTNGGGHR